MPKVSVIIPVYNVENYLVECLDSVINQTEKDIEIICVEDCSTDSSLAILQAYAKKDDRIIILQNEKNSGLSVTRNNGLAIAKGEYILFVDSDDFIEHTLLETTLKYATDVDIVCFDYSEYNDGFMNHSKHNYIVENGLYNNEKYFINAVNSNSMIYAAWCKVYKREFLLENDIRFVPNIIYEDILFYYFCMLKANSIYNINKKLYFYRIRPDSIMTKRITNKNLDDHFYSLCKMTEQYILNDFSLDLSLAIEKFIKLLANKHKRLYKECYSVNEEFNGLFDYDLSSCNKLQRIFSDYFSGFTGDVDFSVEQLRVICNNKYIIVYGAGAIAREVINCLDLKDIIVTGIAVSDVTNNKKSLLGNPVKELNDYLNIKDECLVIIAVSEKFSEEIRKNLDEQGFKNYIKLF